MRRAWLRRRAASSAVTARLRSPGAGDGARGPAVTLSARCPARTGPRRHVARSPFRAGGRVPAPVGASQGLRQPGAGLARGRPSPALSLSVSCSERLVDAEGPLHLCAPGAAVGRKVSQGCSGIAVSSGLGLLTWRPSCPLLCPRPVGLGVLRRSGASGRPGLADKVAGTRAEGPVRGLALVRMGASPPPTPLFPARRPLALWASLPSWCDEGSNPTVVRSPSSPADQHSGDLPDVTLPLPLVAALAG